MIPKGTLLIIGGAEDKGEKDGPDIEGKNKEFEHFEILKELLPKINRSKRKVEIITTASSMPDEMNRRYKKAFEKVGFKNIGFIKIESKPEARAPGFIERVSAAHAVLFTGGDQFTLSAIIGGTDLCKAIKDKYYTDKDFIVAGTSAGAMAIPQIMIYEGGVDEAILKDELKISSGLGILDACIIDTHFIKRGRFVRLANAIVMSPECLGIGLGEDTALIIKKGDLVECRGSGTVMLIDGSGIGQTNITDADRQMPVFIEGLKVHILSNGCRFSINNCQLANPMKKRAAAAKK